MVSSIAQLAEVPPFGPYRALSGQILDQFGE